MHELLLFGQVQSTQHDQVLKLLAGIASMKPDPFTERHLVFKPRKPTTSTSIAGLKPANAQAQALQAQMQGDLFYLQLVGDTSLRFNRAAVLPSRSGNSGSGNSGSGNSGSAQVLTELGDSGTMNDTADQSHDLTVSDTTTSTIDFTSDPWSIDFRDLPEVPGRRPVSSRLMASVPITDGKPLDIMNSMSYTYSSEYVLEGHRLIHNNIILLLHRPLMVPPQAGPVMNIPAVEKLDPLDPSGGFILQAAIRVKDGGKPETMTIAINELTNFRDLMKGAVDLEVADRLALDTRLR